MDRTEQLVTRVDLYFGQLLALSGALSLIEIVLAFIGIPLRYFVISGWVVLLVLTFVLLQRVKRANNLTSDLQVYKLLVAAVLLVMAGYALRLGFLGTEHPGLLSDFFALARFLFVINSFAALAAYALSAVAIYIVDKIHSA